MNKKDKIISIISLIIFLGLCGLFMYLSKTQNAAKLPGDSETASITDGRISALSHEGYTLEQVVILSRHNIRSPLSGGGSLLGTITPHEWFEWSSEPSELSVRGGVLETMMGQYFRKWLESEGLFPENYHPEPEDVRIYANSKQRTIATAQFFTSGLLPTAGEEVEYAVEYDTMDPVFTPKLTYVSDSYVRAATAQIDELFSDDINALTDNYELLTDVIDLHDSEAWKDGSVTDLATDDTEIKLELDAEPGMSGSLKTACSVSDALVLQYYEESDEKTAAFGHDLTRDDWKTISEVKDLYGDVLFTAPLVAVNVANPLLKEILSELNEDGRVFTFLCGHDSNIGSVLAAMDVTDYVLPDSIESKTPIGGKLVFARWKGTDGAEYISVDLVYQTTDQLRDLTILNDDDPPGIYALKFDGLNANSDGLYAAADIEKRLQDAIDEYDVITKE